MSQKRAPHWIYRDKSDRTPGRLVVVDADFHWREVPGKANRQEAALDGWSAVGWTIETGDAEREWERSGLTAVQWWEAALWHLKRGGLCWLVAWHAARVAGLLGVWEMMEKGRLVIYGESRTTGRARRDRPDLRPLPEDGSSGVGDMAGEVVSRMPTVRQRRAGRTGRGRQAKGNADGGTSLAVLEDPPTILRLSAPGYTGSLVLLDSRNWNIEPGADLVGARQRARWLFDAVRRMRDCVRDNKLGALAMTAGAQATNSLRRRFLSHAIHVHDNESALRLEGEALIGGRVECRYIGRVNGPIYHVDFRALYPACCAREQVPTVLVDCGGEHQSVDDAAATGFDGVVADVQVLTQEPAYPMRRDGITCYPVGCFRTCLCGPELADAYSRSRLVRINRMARYISAPALRDVTLAYWRILESPGRRADKPIAAWLKRCMVCLPGKFAQRGGEWVAWPDAPDHAPWSTWIVVMPDGRYIRCRDLAGQAQFERPAPWGANSVPAIHAWICSAARVQLLEAIRAAGWEEVWYVATDALYCSARGYGRLRAGGFVADGAFGKLRLMGVYPEGEFLGSNHYRVGGRVVRSGVPIENESVGPVTGTYWTNDRAKELSRSGRAPTVERQLRVLDMPVARPHGVVGPDGWIRPLEMADG